MDIPKYLDQYIGIVDEEAKTNTYVCDKSVIDKFCDKLQEDNGVNKDDISVLQKVSENHCNDICFLEYHDMIQLSANNMLDLAEILYENRYIDVNQYCVIVQTACVIVQTAICKYRRY